MVVIRTMIDTVILSARDRSSNAGGTGKIMAIRMPMTDSTITISAESRIIPPNNLFSFASIVSTQLTLGGGEKSSTFYWRNLLVK